MWSLFLELLPGGNPSVLPWKGYVRNWAILFFYWVLFYFFHSGICTLSLTCWSICIYTVERVVRLSLLRLLSITAVNSSSLGKSNEIEGISLSYPASRAVFSWVSLFRWCSTSVCAPIGCPSPARCLVGTQPWPQSSVKEGVGSSPCSSTRGMDPPAARDGWDEVSGLFAHEMAGPLFLVKGRWDERCHWCFKVFLSQASVWNDTVHPHFLSSLLMKRIFSCCLQSLESP